MKFLDQALSKLDPDELREYEEAIELWITYGGDQMKLILEKTQKHLDAQGETYFQHMCGAWKIIYLLKTL